MKSESVQVPTDLDVWVLAGQSNMEGCAPLREAPGPVPGIYSFSSAGAWVKAEAPLHRLWESFTPVHELIRRPNLPPEQKNLTCEELAAEEARLRREEGFGRFGCGIPFGAAMQEYTGRPVGLIPAAHGGTSLEQWSHKEKDTEHLYGAMLERIRRAGGNLKGVLWYQGESDTGPESRDTYLDRFTAWIEELRADLGMPNLPVLAVQIATHVLPPADAAEGGAGWEAIRKALYELPAHVPHTAVVSAIDLGLCDGIHIGGSGQIRLGKRLATMVQRMETMDGVSVTPRVRGIEQGTPWVEGLGLLHIRCEGVTGSWLPSEHLSGFSIRTPDGNPDEQTLVIQAFPDPKDGTAINLRLNRPVASGTQVVYGAGLNPFCNVVDESDMPLPAFQASVS